MHYGNQGNGQMHIMNKIVTKSEIKLPSSLTACVAAFNFFLKEACIYDQRWGVP